MLDAWDPLIAAFHAVYGIDLADVWAVKPWTWFTARVLGLFATDNALSRHFQPTPEGT